MSTHRLSKQFNPDLRDLKILHDHPNPSVNVLAIHGLAAHPVETWVAKNGKWNWLKKQLVRLIPDARVWTFGYDSTWCEDKSVDTRLSEVASKLLDAIDQNGLVNKQLIFVAHSFGGIVVSKALLMAENRHNEWAKNGKALNLFQSTDALLFFGTPFGGTHEWFQKDLPGLAHDLTSHVDNGIFETFRQGSDNLYQLRKDILDNLHTYKKPNVGCFQELQVSNVGKIIGDENIPKIVLVQRDDATLADGPSSGEPRILNRPLERNHFDMQKFEEEDRIFQTVEYVLKGVVSNRFLCTSSTKIIPSLLTPDDEEYLKSLSFPDMNDRFYEITKPSWDTCAWLLGHKSYCTWLDKGPDLLCIKGKPGSGKSTIIKFAVEKRASQTPVLASFFFHARGTNLQKTCLGLYRSLLHQLLLQVSSIRSDFRQLYQTKIQAHKSSNWHVNELQDLLTDFITRVGKILPIFIYVDALDECGPEEKRDLSDYLQTLTNLKVSTADMPIKICFSCRHYPRINLQNHLEICVEQENEDDIAKHVEMILQEKYLKFAEHSDIMIIKKIGLDISKRSSNVFQWVSLILKIIDNMNLKGEPWKVIQKKIREVPKGLTDLYTHIISSLNEEDRHQTSILLRWIHFAKRPLSPNELRIAMAFDTNTPHSSLESWRKSDEYYGNYSQWKERITYLSGGLAEVVCREGFQKSFNDDDGIDAVIVQFIHESVNDYFQKEGISMLGVKQPGSVVGQCHKQIARSCVYYIKCPESARSWWRKVNEDGNVSEENVNDDGQFINYAMKRWLWHSEQAENEQCSLEDILVWFDYPSPKFFQQYIHLTNSHLLENPHLLEKSLCFYSGSTYLHIASHANLLSLANVLLTRDLLKADVKDDRGRTALCVACKMGNERMVELLMTSGADVNAQGGSYGNPLQTAIYYGHTTIVELLLKRGADVNTQGGFYGNALQAAARYGDMTMINMLLKSDAEVNAQGGYFGNALQAAAYGAHMTVIDLLLKNGADINAQGGIYNNALEAAARDPPIEMVDSALKRTGKGGINYNALQAGAWGINWQERQAVIQFLIKAWEESMEAVTER